MFFHGNFGFSCVQYGFPIQQNLADTLVWETSLEKCADWAPYKFNPILGLWVQGAWNTQGLTSRGRQSKDFDLANAPVRAALKNMALGLEKGRFVPLSFPHDSLRTTFHLVACLQLPRVIREVTEVSHSLHVAAPLQRALRCVQLAKLHSRFAPQVAHVVFAFLVLHRETLLEETVADCAQADLGAQGFGEVVDHVACVDG